MKKHGLLVVAVGLWIGVSCSLAGAEPLKTLSAEEQDGLRTGKGLKQSMVAELNGYPGPKHVLEFAKKMQLTPQQEEVARALEKEMTANAVALGGEILQRETHLDHLFAAGNVDLAAVTALVGELGQLRSKLRMVHLQSHLAMTKVLTALQIDIYKKMRGHGEQSQGAGHHGGH